MYDDGICQVYEVVNIAEKGNMPKEVLQKCGAFYFGYIKVGINRRFLSKNLDESIDALIESYLDINMKATHICEINGDFYKITFIQTGLNDEGLKNMTIQLEKTDVKYKVKDS